MNTEFDDAVEYFRRGPVTDFMIISPDAYRILNAPPIAPYTLSGIQHVGRIKRTVSATTLKRRAKQRQQRKARLITKRNG